MVYALRYKPRKDHNFEGLDICLMPESVSNGANMSYDDIGRAMDKMYPIWRRFANLEGLAVEQNEFTVWETIGPSAAVLACLIPDGWKPPPEWKDRKPIQNLNEFKGYLFQP
jgi:hypothetical protein